jgi:hypothetical protein
MYAPRQTSNGDARQFLGTCRKRKPGSVVPALGVRFVAAGDVAAPHNERESRCVPLPRVALGCLGRLRLRRFNRSG